MDNVDIEYIYLQFRQYQLEDMDNLRLKEDMELPTCVSPIVRNIFLLFL